MHYQAVTEWEVPGQVRFRSSLAWEPDRPGPHLELGVVSLQTPEVGVELELALDEVRRVRDQLISHLDAVSGGEPREWVFPSELMIQAAADALVGFEILDESHSREAIECAATVALGAAVEASRSPELSQASGFGSAGEPVVWTESVITDLTGWLLSELRAAGVVRTDLAEHAGWVGVRAALTAVGITPGAIR